MKGIRLCRDCDQSELDVHLSNGQLCHDCGLARVTANYERAWAIGLERRSLPKDGLQAQLRAAAHQMTRMHQEAAVARLRREIAMRERRAAQAKPTRPSRAKIPPAALPRSPRTPAGSAVAAKAQGRGRRVTSPARRRAGPTAPKA